MPNINSKTEITKVPNKQLKAYETDRFLMRPVVESDRAFYLSLHCDAKVMEHISPPLTAQQANKAFDTTLKQIAKPSPKILAWIVIEKQSNQAVAYQAVSWYLHAQAKTDPLFQTNGQPEVGIILSSQHQGKGYAVEAVGSLVEYVFTRLNYSLINFFYYKKHNATKRLLKKLDTLIDPCKQPINPEWEYQWLQVDKWKKDVIQ